jgi:hypothetical protein
MTTRLSKKELIQLIKRILDLNKNGDLDFLFKLDSGELEVLLAAIRDRMEQAAQSSSR